MKKTIAIILSVLLIMGVVSVAAVSAAADATIQIGESAFECNQGDTLTYTLNMTTPKAIQNGQFIVYYPGTCLTVNSVEFNKDVFGSNEPIVNYTEVADEIDFNFSNIEGYDFTEKKALVTVEFAVTGTGEGKVYLSDKEEEVIVCDVDDAIISSKIQFEELGSVKGQETKPATAEPTQSITEKPTEAPKTDSFMWGTDNYNFNNSAPDYFKDLTYRAQINNKYLKTLKDNLTNIEYQVIFGGELYSDAWLDEDWGGSCYGMSSTTLLAKQGLLPFANYKAGATKLNDLYAPKNDLELSSLITYYQMLQVKDVIQQQYRTVPNKSNETNIKNIISTLDKESTVLLGFLKDGWGGHAILATGYEYGSWTWDKVTYQGCIKICDPNASTGYNKAFNIYFNTGSYNWTIPAYSVIKSTLGAKFNYIGADINDINKGGYLSGNSGNKVSDYVARINALKISNNRSVSKVKETNGIFTALNASPGEIVEDYAYILGNESEGIAGYNLYDAKSAYKISQDNAQNMQLNIDYEKCRMSGGSQVGKSVIFDNKGIVKVQGESAEYNMSMTFDENYPTDWFTMTVSGEDSDNAVLEKTDEGYILKADKLKNVVVKANNRENSASTMFSADYSSAFIYEINEKVIGIKVDTDNDGTFDSDVDTVEAPTQEPKPIVTEPMSTEPSVTTPIVTDPITTEPLVTEPVVTNPISTEPITPPVLTDPTQPDSIKPATPKVTSKKANPIKVTAKTKTVKAKKLKKKAQTVKPITVKGAQGKVTYKLVKSGITKKIRKLVKINSKGVITIKKWNKAKKGTYSIKVKITAAGNAKYNSKTITKTVKVKVK